MSDCLAQVTVELNEARATALAMFLKRLMLDVFEAACSLAERSAAYQCTMQSATFNLANAFFENGFNPR